MVCFKDGREDARNKWSKFGSKRHSLQAVELSQRTQAAVQFVSNLWMAGAVAHKSG